MSGPMLFGVAVGALLVTALIGWRVPRGEGYLSIDRRVQWWVTYGRGRSLDRRVFGETYGRRIVDVLLTLSAVVLPLAAAGRGLLLGRAWRDRRGLWATMLALLLSPIVTEMVLKPTIGRRLDGSLAYPSGAATMITLAVMLLGLITFRYRGPGRAIGTVVGAGAVAFGLALLLISREWHYFSDLVGGVGVGVGVPALVWSLGVGRWGRPRVRAENGRTGGTGTTAWRG